MVVAFTVAEVGTLKCKEKKRTRMRTVGKGRGV